MESCRVLCIHFLAVPCGPSQLWPVGKNKQSRVKTATIAPMLQGYDWTAPDAKMPKMPDYLND
jgi:hypothetical protein